MRPHKISEAILNVIAASDEVLAAKAAVRPANLAGPSLPADDLAATDDRAVVLAD